jgi:hypothetical protein
MKFAIDCLSDSCLSSVKDICSAPRQPRIGRQKLRASVGLACLRYGASNSRSRKSIAARRWGSKASNSRARGTWSRRGIRTGSRFGRRSTRRNCRSTSTPSRRPRRAPARRVVREVAPGFRRRCFRCYSSEETATKSPFASEILGSRKPEQRNNSELSAVFDC